MKASERLSEIIRNIKFSKRLTQSEIACEVGVSATYLSDVLNGRAPVSELFSDKLTSVFREYSKQWLLTGEGDMLLQSPAPSGIEDDIPERDLVLFFPNLLVSASVLENMPLENQEYTQLALPGLGGCWAITVRGESMYPRVNSGDIVIFDPHTAEWIRNGEMYVVVTRDNHSMIKRVTELPPTEDGSRRFRFISENPDQTLYAPIEIDAQNIIAIYPVRGFLSYQQ